MYPSLTRLTAMGALAFTLGLSAASQERSPRNPIAELDTNGDGAISREEAEVPRQEAFARADANGDGGVSFAEMEAFAEAERERRLAERAERRFASADQNGDGVLSYEEFRPRGANRFDRVDADGDGLMTQDELDRARERWRASGRRGPRGRGS